MEMVPWARILILVARLFPTSIECIVRHYKFNVVLKNSTKLCSSKQIVTVNGKYPGSTIYAREDDTLLIKVVNHVQYNLKVREALFGGTLTSCGLGPLSMEPLSSYPSAVSPIHSQTSHRKGEWWKSDVEAVINEALKSGLAPNVSDAHTINGLPGAVSDCPSQGGYSLPVEAGKTYLLRIVNAALNEELFFKIAGHQLTVVEVDAVYTKAFKTDTVVIAPGQTTNVLLTADRNAGKYSVIASSFMDAPIAVDNKTATATLHYSGTISSSRTILTAPLPQNATSIAS
ncbi:hypothetical protein TIFTF001_000283 [Ficus carica]|uniref:laccase n=1 Tax=Ficus carica TaxID=3494 RepID=A0AA87Z299_FICCA|nr:hypothetical protein TIFTF001_000283 [Ficus carica]